MSIHPTGFSDQHAQCMDGVYGIRRHLYDATHRCILLGRKELVGRLAPPSGGAVLEVGCGTAWNLIEAARVHAGARLYGLDISEAMLATARKRLAIAGLADRVALVRADATGFKPAELFDCAAFDRIFISYALSMIPNWRDAIDRSARMLAPGGELHIIDFGRGTGMPRLCRTALRAWLAWFNAEPRRDLEPALVRIAARLDLEVEFASLYRDYAMLAVLRRRA